MNVQQRIVDMVRRSYESANEVHKKAYAEHMAWICGANTWEEYNPDDGVGGMSQNPFNVDPKSKIDEQTRIYLSEMKQAYDLAVNTFLENDDQVVIDKNLLREILEHDVANIGTEDEFFRTYTYNSEMPDWVDKVKTILQITDEEE